MAMLAEQTKLSEKKKQSHGFATDELAEWIIHHCANVEEVARMVELAKRFSFGLSAAIERAGRMH